MAELAQIWAELLPDLRRGVTGVGVWAALNAVKPIILEDKQVVLGLPYDATELSGHLKLPNTKRLMEIKLGEKLGNDIILRIIDGVSIEDWETAKRRDQEGMRLQELARQRAKAELDSKSTWDTTYEALNRKYGALQNKSLPQNRAKFFSESIDMIVETYAAQDSMDDLAERNYARCLERVSQYTELPSVFIALIVQQRLDKK